MGQLSIFSKGLQIIGRNICVENLRAFFFREVLGARIRIL